MLLAAMALPVSARADQVVQLDPATDTVRVAGKLDGTLTGPARGAAATIGLRWVREHRARLGLSLADLDTLGEPRVETFDGIRQVRWPQVVDGVAAADAELRVNVAEDGRLISVLGSPSSDLPADTTPRLAKPRADAELTFFENRLAYRYTDGARHVTIVDADTGEVLRRRNLTKSVDARVWDNHPVLPVSSARLVDLGRWGTAADKLQNRWMRVYADLDGDDDTAPRDVVPGDYPFQPFAGTGCTDLTPCSWTGGNRTANVEQNAVQAYYLANRFREHLAAPPIGFDGFGGDDPLLIETSDGGGINNANMYTPPDGESPVMQMYLWGNASEHRNVNGGDDASILWHEYTHGLTERTVVDAAGEGALWTDQAYAMAEGWSDYYAKDLLVARGLEADTAAPAEIHMGAYVDRAPKGTRHQALDCPVGAAADKCPANASSGPGGFTYGDYGRILGEPEPHADGEIWAQTLWDLRTAIGAPEALRLVTTGLRMTPPEPTFLDGRDAILRADQASGGTRQAAIWRVFATRGMGGHASAAEPLEDFSVPGQAADTTLTATPAALVNTGVVAFSFTGTSPRFECSLDGGAFRACASGQSWPVADGAHTFAVRSVGDATPATYGFTVDTVAPETTLTDAPPAVLGRGATVAFAASEPASFACSLDGGAAVPCSSPWVLSGLGDGPHGFAVAATDAAGNVDPTPARGGFTVAFPVATPSPTPPPPTAGRRALTSASAARTVSRRTGRVKVTLRGPSGARVSVQAKIGKRVVGSATRTLRRASLSLQLALDKKRLRVGATVTVRVRGTGSGLKAVTRTLKVRVRA